MNLYLLTASHDQHLGFQHAARYVNRSLPLLGMDAGWIIADDGQRSVFEHGWCAAMDELTNPLQCIQLRRESSNGGLPSFIGNMRNLAAMLMQLSGPTDVAAVIEDDWFAPDYLARMAGDFAIDPQLLLAGETQTRYYHVGNRRWHVFKPNGRAALSATVFRARWGAERIIEWANRVDPTMMLDDVLWRRSGVDEHRKRLWPESRYVVGIKGLPGSAGLGMGSGMDERYAQDADGSLLRRWVGDDAATYEGFFRC